MEKFKVVLIITSFLVSCCCGEIERPHVSPDFNFSNISQYYLPINTINPLTGTTFSGVGIPFYQKERTIYIITAKHVVDFPSMGITDSTLSLTYVKVSDLSPPNIYGVNVIIKSKRADIAIASFDLLEDHIIPIAPLSFKRPLIGEEVGIIGDPIKSRRMFFGGRIAGECGVTVNCSFSPRNKNEDALMDLS